MLFRQYKMFTSGACVKPRHTAHCEVAIILPCRDKYDAGRMITIAPIKLELFNRPVYSFVCFLEATERNKERESKKEKREGRQPERKTDRKEGRQ